MVIVDSSVWIDALRGISNRQSAWLNAALGKEQIGLTSLILCEVLQGIRTESQFRKSRIKLLELPVFEVFTAQVAIVSAQNFRTLRERGITVRKSIDCIIATFCIEEGYQLLHRDRDFDPFETYLALRVLHPPSHAPN
jgi:predicted nucleic acid-binding protein